MRYAVVNPEFNYQITSLVSLRRDTNKTIIIEADIQKDTKLIKNVCGRVKIPIHTEFQINPREIDIIFSECNFSGVEKVIVVKEISRSIWDRSSLDAKNIYIEIPILVNKEIQYRYYKMLDVEPKEINGHISVAQGSHFSKRKSINAAWYPVAFSYDLLSGTIHSIGAPFGMICIYGIGNSKNGYFFLAALPFCGIYKVFSFLDEIGGERPRVTDEL
ncbi:hypothetical protein [Leptospira licerasiae]|uniref:hypothetical protein n=1 Tax=Leptospira licerasiae TaxID=447106 RepID=UPI0030185FA9